MVESATPEPECVRCGASTGYDLYRYDGAIYCDVHIQEVKQEIEDYG